MTPGIIGGLLLILGSYTVYTGKIFYSVFIFFVADCCWVYLSYLQGDIFGTITIAIGMILGLLAFFKMKNNKMRKTLDL